MLVTDIDSRLTELYDEMVTLRRHFHQHPELSFEERETPRTIATYLRDLDLDVREHVGGNGVVARIQGGCGPTIAFRADFDALPIQDLKDVPYRSKVNGSMHACGHDAHTATLLVLAKALTEIDLPGDVVLIHQFAEELAPGGAKPMIEDGCLDGVDYIYGSHIWTPLPFGTIGVKTGPIMAAADRFELTIKGKGGHGAIPQHTVDAVMVGTNIVSQLQQVVSRRIDPLEPAVLTVGTFVAGQAFNVIADEAKLSGTVRTFTPETQTRIITEMERTIAHICSASEAHYELDYIRGYPAVINHAVETEHVRRSAARVVGTDGVIEMAPLMVGEDFAYYMQHVPGSFFFTGAGNPEVGAVFPHHHPRFDVDERAMLHTARILLHAAFATWDTHKKED
ncbi:M20 family metallopeptidase [Exiguobacterium sp. AM39-5BH]|uniref:M20 metallopeptidase family protein n=1 Tax=Exiguobacterium sp. AM39-5BH TaxID=2292355 RepID=UPI000FE1AC6E|nr:amidohydrolase [Exiguobacterium sp. AM39-5BH]RHB50019.1 amidohydrolase [Exiguobacterium sp. AM39-5BH]